jgi:rubredoxin
MGERTESELRPDEGPRRPACPMCGSTRTQPFTHAGPAARVNMKCTNCGHLSRGPAKS